MANTALDPKLRALADVYIGVFVRQLICEQRAFHETKKKPGPFSDSPGRSDVLRKQRSSAANFSTAVSMGSLPEGNTGDQNHSKQNPATSAPDDRVGGVVMTTGRTGGNVSK